MSLLAAWTTQLRKAQRLVADKALAGTGKAARKHAAKTLNVAASQARLRGKVSHKALPLPCVSTVFLSKTVPFHAVLHNTRGKPGEAQALINQAMVAAESLSKSSDAAAADRGGPNLRVSENAVACLEFGGSSAPPPPPCVSCLLPGPVRPGHRRLPCRGPGAAQSGPWRQVRPVPAGGQADRQVSKTLSSLVLSLEFYLRQCLSLRSVCLSVFAARTGGTRRTRRSAGSSAGACVACGRGSDLGARRPLCLRPQLVPLSAAWTKQTQAGLQDRGGDERAEPEMERLQGRRRPALQLRRQPVGLYFGLRLGQGRCVRRPPGVRLRTPALPRAVPPNRPNDRTQGRTT
eukprot:SAG22_NODE_1203_length_5178_cov_1.734200_3_plen_347_part_00